MRLPYLIVVKNTIVLSKFYNNVFSEILSLFSLTYIIEFKNSSLKYFFLPGTMVQKQHAIRRNEYSSNGRSIESTYPHFEFNSVRSRFWQLLVCGRKFSRNFQVSSLLTFFFYFSCYAFQFGLIKERK